jgi:hypothetical protein
MHGLGDNLYQRAVLQTMTREVWLSTPWPQFYGDLDHVRCLKPLTKLRTQAKNAARGGFARNNRQTATRRWHYTADPKLSILESLSKEIGMPTPARMSGPSFDLPRMFDEPYIVVRPVCHRAEWASDSRSPLPEYIAEAVEVLRRDFKVISVADLEHDKEWALEPLPYADVRFHKGELPVEQLLSLVENASGLVGGVGWIVPASLSYQVPLLLVYGGWGLSNSPSRVIGSIEASFIDQVLPDEFCMCNTNRHACDKRISDFRSRARAFADRIIPRAFVDATNRYRVVSSHGATL